MKLDHIVHFVRNEPQKIESYWQQMGLPASIGGQHIDWGTQNVLLYLQDSYIEWLSVEHQQIANHADHPLTRLLLHDQLGFGTICLRTENLLELNHELQTRGIKTTGVLDAERKTTDGQLIKWKMLFITEQISTSLPSPFFIEWQETDEQRYQTLKDRGVVQAVNETLSIERCVFGVWNPVQAEEAWKKILGGTLELENCRIEFRKTVQPKERLEEVHFKGGTEHLEFQHGQYWLPRL